MYKIVSQIFQVQSVQDIGDADVHSVVMSATHNQFALKCVEFCLYVHKGAYFKEVNAYKVIGNFLLERPC